MAKKRTQPPKKSSANTSQNKRRRPSTSATTSASSEQPQHHQKKSQTETVRAIIAIGASAGGLEALKIFFQAMTENMNLAFVVITHQMPDRMSFLPDLLSRVTSLTVLQAEDAMNVKPNTVYVSPPGHFLAIYQGSLYLTELPKTGLRLPIDHFFRSLAEDQAEKAIGIVLSGTGSDGTLGVKMIKSEGGMTMAQEPGSAKQSGMPQSALSTGLVDCVLPVQHIPDKVFQYLKHRPSSSTSSTTELESPIRKTLVLLREQTKYDFSGYKFNTMRRRIERRMGMHHLTDINAYNRLLQEQPQESKILAKEMLIGVTTFFRDALAWNALAQTIREYLSAKSHQNSIRVWVVGCSTGEEAYSLAIVIHECLSTLQKNLDVKIFSTDLDENSISTARTGIYAESIVSDISPERLKQFFIKENHHYRIQKEIRDMVTFAPQNAIADPPFSQLDFLCCRNFLIYLESKPQERLLHTFRYALKQGGLLFLGPSETLGKVTEQFVPIEKRWRIYRNLGNVLYTQSAPSPGEIVVDTREDRNKDESIPSDPNDIPQAIHQLLASTFAPPAAVIHEHGNVVFIHGRTGLFLEPSSGPGHIPQNLFRMAREGLRQVLSENVQKAAKTNTPIHEHVWIKTNGERQRIHVSVRPLSHPAILRGLFLVIFERGDQQEKESRHTVESTRAHRSVQKSKRDPSGIDQELENTQRHLQQTIEELETSNEELKSANEEGQSINEELQSTNEELETSKEEMQSLNEELHTVNLEYQGKIEELSQANDDLKNIMNNTEIATVFLDKQLRIKLYTTPITNIIKIIPSDIGRPIEDLVSKLTSNGLTQDAAEVLHTLTNKEKEVSTTENGLYTMRIFPYRTTDDKIEGVVIIFIDIKDLKQQQEMNNQLLAIIESSEDGFIGYTIEGTIIGWNTAAYKIYGYSHREVYNHNIDIIIPDEHKEEMDRIRKQVRQGESIRPFESIRKRKDGKRISVLITISSIRDRHGTVTGFSTIHRPIDMKYSST
ncbi:CheR family methyltransferase [Candidatus Nitrospira salsa]